MKDKGWLYLGDVSNLVDVGSALLNVLLIVKEDFFHGLYDIQAQ